MMPAKAMYPVAQEFSLELPLGYSPVRPAPHRVAVLLHAFHLDLLREIRAYLAHIQYPADLFVSTDTAAKAQVAAACFADWNQGAVEVRVVPNRGRDVAAKLVGFGTVHDRYEYVLHLHTKRSPHDVRLAGWRGYLLETLLGSPEVVSGVFEAFALAPKLGMLAPQHVDVLRPWIRWAGNFEEAETLAKRMGFALSRQAPLDFPSGSMFWARSAALRPLLDLALDFADFPDESGQADATLAHSIERLYYLVCEQAGFDWMKITARGELHDQTGVVAVAGPETLQRFISRRRVRLGALRKETQRIEDSSIATLPQPMPRRVLDVLWRQPLGNGLSFPAGRRLVIMPRGDTAEQDGTARSASAALRDLPGAATGEVLVMPSNKNDAARRNAALRAGFAAGADLVLLLDAPGLLHPGSGAALLLMSEAHDGRVLLEAACFPLAAPKYVDGDDFSVSWAGGPALAVPRALFEAAGGFDESLAGQCADMEFSERARALGFGVRHCPRALFFTASGTGT